ncbi:hypothetical protein BpHYR1_042928 [Brachionus plicatilis]|uniref:Uncharacterized protein n=1 Tax=Brachionus plicatilis TaxID=10195 RepID=A0A3M7SVH5_BRAPC|nr:hypothetical protein BpHYR1_042928 [Brachionus plicatilis]
MIFFVLKVICVEKFHICIETALNCGALVVLVYFYTYKLYLIINFFQRIKKFYLFLFFVKVIFKTVILITRVIAFNFQIPQDQQTKLEFIFLICIVEAFFNSDFDIKINLPYVFYFFINLSLSDIKTAITIYHFFSILPIRNLLKIELTAVGSAKSIS